MRATYIILIDVFSTLGDNADIHQHAGENRACSGRGGDIAVCTRDLGGNICSGCCGELSSSSSIDNCGERSGSISGNNV